jgi:hypothetical protein
MSFERLPERSRDVQDGTECHVWGEQEYIKNAGSIIKVKGTDTQDEEAEVVCNGTGFNLPKDHDSEVFLLASSSDTQMKQAVLTIPKDKQRKWKEKHGGVQNPMDNEWALDFGDKLAHVTKKEFAVGKDGEFEIDKDKNVYFRLDGTKKFIIDGELIVNKIIRTPQIVNGKQKPPGFQGNTEAQAKSGDSGNSGQTMYDATDYEVEVEPMGPLIEEFREGGPAEVRIDVKGPCFVWLNGELIHTRA